MDISVGPIITLLLVQLLVSLAADVSNNIKYKIRSNCKIKNGLSMENCTAGSLMNCVAKCTIRTGCISIAWNENTSVCMVSVHDTISEVDSSYSKYEQAEDWACASIIRFPVFRALNSTYAENRYEMSFPRASARCAELGTSLADPSSLTTAQNLGLSYCNCAWMSDGSNALLLDNYDGGCFHSYNTGPIRCGFTWADAWCLMP